MYANRFCKRFRDYLALFFVCQVVACGPGANRDPKSTERKVAVLASPLNHQVLRYGDILPVQLKLDPKYLDQIDSIVLIINEKRKFLIDRDNPNAQLPLENMALGRASVLVRIHLNSRTQENKLAYIKILSNMVPLSYTYSTIASYPHNVQSYTQGLLWHNGFLYESTGQRGFSKLLKVDLATGQALQSHDLDKSLFGEGLALWKDRLIQLTWTSGLGLVYDLSSFAEKGKFSYPGEGWGLTTDGSHLIMSNGTNELAFLNPETFAKEHSIWVMDHKGEVDKLNELEFVEGEIWANYYEYEIYRIVRIDPKTGQVTGYIDLTGLIDKDRHESIDVLNGIAYDPVGKRLWVTGKYYPKLYQIEVLVAEDL
jgi:glutamine cyclotransferase